MLTPRELHTISLEGIAKKPVREAQYRCTDEFLRFLEDLETKMCRDASLGLFGTRHYVPSSGVFESFGLTPSDVCSLLVRSLDSGFRIVYNSPQTICVYWGTVDNPAHLP